MSFWDNVKKFAQPYTDEDYDDYDDGAEGFEDEVAEPAPRERHRPTVSDMPVSEPTVDAPSDSSRFGGKVLNMGGNKQSVVLFRPTSFSDASKAADDLKDKKVVIVNMENVDKAMARRVVDFLSGCSYALEGKARKIAQSTYLFAPYNMDVMGDLENIQAETESYV